MAMESLGILDKPEAEYETLQGGETDMEAPMMEQEETPMMDDSMIETEEEPQQMQRGLMARG